MPPKVQRGRRRRLGATVAVAGGVVLVACAALARGGGPAPDRLALAVPSWVWVDDTISGDDATTASHHANRSSSSADALGPRRKPAMLPEAGVKAEPLWVEADTEGAPAADMTDMDSS